MEKLPLGRSAPIGPKAGSRVRVRGSNPVGTYPLRHGLKPGDGVVLLDFDRGWWDVQRECDGAAFNIYQLNVGEVLLSPAPISVAKRRATADWKRIIEAAQHAAEQLSRCSKPGQRMRQIYFSTYREACVSGYNGSEDDWEKFVRRRG